MEGNVIGRRMEQRRLQLNLGLKDVADRMVNTKPSPSAIHHWETGRRTPRMEYVPDIAQALDTSPMWLFGYTDEPQSQLSAGSLYANLPSPVTIQIPGRPDCKIESDKTLRIAESELVSHKLNPADLFFVRATDSVMGEKIGDGDLVLVDRSVTLPSQADIFAMLVNERIWFRWIRPEIDGSFVVFAENDSKSPPTRIEADKLHTLAILGRVASVTRFR